MMEVADYRSAQHTYEVTIRSGKHNQYVYTIVADSPEQAKSVLQERMQTVCGWCFVAVEDVTDA